MKQLRLTSITGKNKIVNQMDFSDENMLDFVLKDSNVVINLIGNRYKQKSLQSIKNSNVTVAMQIAKACARNKNIKRFIHFSAAGVDYDSPSLSLQTKFIGEEVVKEIFPDVTIFRPTTVFHYNDYFTNYFEVMNGFFYKYMIVTSDCKALRQPIHLECVAQAVLNALKIEDSIGHTYELGGPHVYSLLECWEVMYNIIGKRPSINHLNYEVMYQLASVLPNGVYFSKEQMIKERLDLVAGTPGIRQIEDLMVQPVSFPQAAEQHLRHLEIKTFGDRDKENT